MRVLISNIDMRFLTGTVVVVRDFGLELRRRGHKVTVYSPRLGDPARDLAKQGVSVVDSVDNLAMKPDIIHGHHNLPTIGAMARFVTAPAIWICHGRGQWFDSPPLLSHVHRYLAVDTLRRDLLTKVFGVAEVDVEILPNAVDLKKFPPRTSPLPAKPGRLLLFAKTADIVAAVLTASRTLGMEVDAIGGAVRRPTTTPERFLRKADVVIATGRMAIEAACAGAAVVVADTRGIAGMMTSQNYDALRRVNFGATSLVRKFTGGALEAEIRRYDSDDAALVSARMRDDADLEKIVDRLEALYRDAMALNTGSGWTAADSAFVKKTLDQWPARVDPDRVWLKLRAELSALAVRNDSA